MISKFNFVFFLICWSQLGIHLRPIFSPALQAVKISTLNFFVNPTFINFYIKAEIYRTFWARFSRWGTRENSPF